MRCARHAIRSSLLRMLPPPRASFSTARTAHPTCACASAPARRRVASLLSTAARWAAARGCGTGPSCGSCSAQSSSPPPSATTSTARPRSMRGGPVLSSCRLSRLRVTTCAPPFIKRRAGRRSVCVTTTRGGRSMAARRRAASRCSSRTTRRCCKSSLMTTCARPTRTSSTCAARTRPPSQCRSPRRAAPTSSSPSPFGRLPATTTSCV
mmetsp:Transcript_77206/g.231671  ORF Transcript_77206/g.231671 Transcript_77206/m.231671 type:complete len:209 (+) Transcript_77206:401-1027(+)